MDSSLPPSHRYTKFFLLLYGALIFPVSALLPFSASFENGPIENLQVVVLLGGALLCAAYARRAKGAPTHGMWLASSGIFLILALRELSWGRVFLVQGYTNMGEPILLASADMPFRTPIQGAVGFFAVLCLYLLAKNTPWKRVFHEISFPWLHLALIAAGVILSSWGDHHTIYYTLRDQVIEEMAELLMYLTLCHLAWYYYLKIEKNR